MVHAIRLFLVCILIAPVIAQGEEISIPLPELIGHYVSVRGGGKEIDLYCGIQFTDIQSVYIACEGDIIPGTLYNINTKEYTPFGCEFEFIMFADLGSWIASLRFESEGPEMSYFARYPSPYYTPTWDFLLDGKAVISASIGPCGYTADSVLVISPSGNITDARLIIDGTLNPIDAIELLKPNTRQFLLSGTTYRIQWNDWRHYGKCSGNFQISYSLDNGETWIPITESPLSNVCYYDWQVPAVMAENCLIKVEEINSSLTDTSDITFSIYVCSTPPAGDFTGDCFVNNKDLQAISRVWLVEGGYTITDLFHLAENWLGCRNTYDPDCQL